MTMTGKLLSQLGMNTLSDTLSMYLKYRHERFPPWRVVIQELSRRGFMRFKFEGRSLTPLKEWAEPIISFIETQ